MDCSFVCEREHIHTHHFYLTDLEETVFKKKVTYSLKFTFILIPAISDLYKMEDSLRSSFL